MSDICEFKPGHRRRIYESRPGVWSIEIQHRISSDGVTPEIWSFWSWWGNGVSKNDVITRHNAMIDSNVQDNRTRPAVSSTEATDL
jgi:hypothetical protein